MTFTEKIRDLTATKEKSIEEISNEINIPYKRLNSWFLGKGYPTKKEKILLAEYSGWSISYWDSENPMDKYKRIRKTIYLISIPFVTISLILSIFFSIFGACLSSTYSNRTFTYQDFEYDEFRDGISINNYSGTNKNLIIPDTIPSPIGLFQKEKRVYSFSLRNILCNSNIESISISKTVNSIRLPGDNPPHNTEDYSLNEITSYSKNKLERITVSLENEVYDSRNDCNAIFQKKDDTLLFGTKNCYIPPSTKVIGQCALLGYEKETVIIPNGVVGICWWAFYNSTMKELILPSSIEYIGGYAFYNCNNLSEVIIPKNCEIDETTFPSATKLYMEISYTEAKEHLDNQYFYSETLPVVPGNYWHYDANNKAIIW